MSTNRTRLCRSLLAGCIAVGLSGCSNGSSATAGDETTTAPPPPSPIRILLSNDDGIGATGIDLMAQALGGLSDVELIISAPAKDQSGTGGTKSTAAPKSSPAKTASGIAGVAVEGYPADAVAAVLDKSGTDLDLVIAGVNKGSNLGPFRDLSGTIGAARFGAKAGHPALAVSAGVEGEAGYVPAIQATLDWIAKHRTQLMDGTVPAGVTLINAPNCAKGTKTRGAVEVPPAADFKGRSIAAPNCASTLEHPTDDVEAFINGFVAVSPLPDS